MGRRARAVSALAAALATSVLIAGGTLAHQHGTDEGHLIGSGAWGKIQLVGSVELVDQPDLIADVAVDPDGNYAYLAHWGSPECFSLTAPGNEAGGRKDPDAGVFVVDISNLSAPREVAFIPMHQDTRPGEGMQVIEITTSKFSGDVLAVNEEACGKNYKAGFSLWDVTDPLKPKKLAKNFGDFTVNGGRKAPHDANQTHSVFMWDAGDRAYLVAQDEEEFLDVDIFDITDPKHPKLIAELDLNDFGVSQPQLSLTESFLHDMIVKQIDGRWIMLLSYWDGGWVLLDVTDPANPEFLADTDYAAVDQLTGVSPPEGNAHQAEFTIDNQFIIGTDEDFAPYRLTITFEDGTFLAKPGTNTTVEDALAIGTLDPDAATGATPIFVGRACPGDPAVPPAPNLPGDEIAVVERGVCFFTEKVAAVLAAGGYEAVIIMNREGADACQGAFTPSVEGDIPTIFIGRDTGFALFDIPFDAAACLDATPQLAPIAIGTQGDPITDVGSAFDGWGYVRLFDAATLTELDQYAIPEALDPAFATGFGDLSVHEVAVDPQDASLAYLAYYSGGLRAVQIQCANPADTSTCRLVEVGGYLDEQGNDFWGVETFVRNGETYILASDRDYGLFIFRDP